MPGSDGVLWVPDQIVVITNTVGSDAAAIAERLAGETGADLIGGSFGLGIFQLEFDAGDVDEQLPVLARAEGVAAAGRLRASSHTTAQGDDWDDPRWDGISPGWPFELLGIDELWDQGLSGAGVGVLVADFGIFDSHTDLAFAGTVASVHGDSVVDRMLWDITQVAHGTAVAGLACGAGGNGGLVGVAPACDLYGVDLLYSLTAGHETPASSAVAFVVMIEEALARHPGIRVVNLSIGFGPNPAGGCDRPADAVDIWAMHRLIANHPDVLFVAAAGNCGIEHSPIDSIDDIAEQPITVPAGLAALLDNIIGVTAVNGDTTTPGFANTGAGITIAAPGGTSTERDKIWAPSAECGLDGCDSTYDEFTGTSVAAPFVTGIAALLFEANPTLTPAELRACLQTPADTANGSAPQTSILLSAPAALGCVTGTQPAPAIPDEAITSDQFPGLIGIPTDGALYMDYDPDAPLPAGRCSVRLAAGVERSDDAALYSYTEIRDGVTETLTYNETDIFGVGIFGGPPWVVDEVLVDSGESSSKYLGYGFVNLIGIGDTQDCVARLQGDIADGTYNAFGFTKWVLAAPYQPPLRDAAVELTTHWDGDKCTFVEWWTVPSDWLDQDRNLQRPGDTGAPIPVTGDVFDGTMPEAHSSFDPDLVEPYTRPGRAAFARRSGATRSNCAWLEYITERTLSGQ